MHIITLKYTSGSESNFFKNEKFIGTKPQLRIIYTEQSEQNKSSIFGQHA